MLKNYINIAIRKARQNILYSVINSLGLSLGIAAFLFIIQFVSNELKIDQFHHDPDRVFRMISDLKWDTTEDEFSSTPPALGTAIVSDFEEVEYVTRILPEYSEIQVWVEDKLFLESNTMAVDSNFLRIFNFRLLQGNPGTLFSKPNSVVLPESYVLKYFGEAPALGAGLKIGEKEYKVTGVIEDAPENGHINYSLLISINSDKNVAYFEWSWVWSNLVTYIKLKEGVDATTFSLKLPDLVKNNAGYSIERITGKSLEDFYNNGNRINFKMQPLSEVYYQYENPIGPKGNKTYIYVFGGIAFLILILACINYTNLATARSIKRAKEVGIRKVVGSSKMQLIFQFLTESILFSLFASLLAVLIGEVIYSSLTDAFGIRWDLSPMSNWTSLLYILAIALSVGLISGLYPAIYLSSFNPAHTIKGINQQGESRSFFRNSLVVFQFLISFGIIIMAFTVNRQIDFLRNRNFGFDQDKLLVISNINFLKNRDPFRNEVEQLSAVSSSTFTNVVPGKGGYYELFKKVADPDPDHIMILINADENFLKTFGIKLLSGKNYTEADLTKTEERFAVINQKASEEFDLNQPIGERIYALDDGRNLEISGLIDQIDFDLSTGEYNSIVIRPYSKFGNASTLNFLTVRLNSGNLQSTVSEIEKLWTKQDSGMPFQYYFYDQIFDQNFKSENRLSSLLDIFSGIAVFIGLLGLVGLVSYNTERLQKSIGIRKVFGASIFNILLLLTRDFIKLIIIAFAIAIPLANYFITDWLNEFIYRVNVEVWFFAIPGIIILIVAMITIWGQSYRSARANPVDSIRGD